MNNMSAGGRITKEIELKKSVKGVPYCRFNLACKGTQIDEDKRLHTDFFTCVAWRSNAENLSKYCKKGDYIDVYGSMISRTYKNEHGQNTTIWELNAEKIEFVGNRIDKNEASKKPEGVQIAFNNDLEEISDEDLPF